MSATKQRIDKINEYGRIAFEALSDIGAIAPCYSSNDYYFTYKYDKAAIYGIVTKKIKKEHPELDDFKLLHEQIKHILMNAAEGADEGIFS